LERVNPTLIDYFLSQNSDLHDIGRLAIAMVIFDCERVQSELGGNPNHHVLYERQIARGNSAAKKPSTTAFNDDWLRFILYKITVGCQSSEALLANKVSFITFNYDTSLEKRLFDGLTNIALFADKDINQFLFSNRIFHVYGKVRERIDRGWAPSETALPGESGDIALGLQRLDPIFAASKGIRTIDGEDKLKDIETLKVAKEKLREAASTYIFGYGFDASNNERIGLDALRPGIEPKDLVVRFTNFGGHNRVGMAAGKILTSDGNAMLPPKGPIREQQALNNQRYYTYRYEMSVKDVYGALAEDFESLEA
jgi:hypothetical protein